MAIFLLNFSVFVLTFYIHWDGERQGCHHKFRRRKSQASTMEYPPPRIGLCTGREGEGGEGGGRGGGEKLSLLAPSRRLSGPVGLSVYSSN